MPRETDLLEAFIEFADTFTDEYDVLEFLNRLAERTLQLLDATEAGIMLADKEGALHCVASSTERMRLIEVFETEEEEGPSIDAYASGAAVHSELDADAFVRWPQLAPHATGQGFRSVSAVPMRLRTQVIGALNIFSTNPRPMGKRDRVVAQALADVATIGILQERALAAGKEINQQLETALMSRVQIEQAKGIIAQQSAGTLDNAFLMIRTYARTHNEPLGQLAHAIIMGTITAEDLRYP